MQTSTVIILGFLVVIVMLSSCQGAARRTVNDDDDDDDDDDDSVETKVRMFLEAKNEDDFEKRANSDGCVRCKLGLIKCCYPNQCVTRLLLPDYCQRIKQK